MIFSCVHFECTQCGTNSDIYFEKEFDASEVKELCICSECSGESYCNVGDLGYRNDLSDPAYPPWQAQVVRLSQSSILCDLCILNKKDALSNYNLIAWCECCNQESMDVIGFSELQHPELSALLNSIN